MANFNFNFYFNSDLFGLGLKTPDTNAEIIEIIGEASLISKDKVEKYIKMSQFRNRIVHLYNQIDPETIYDILVNELDDLKEFYKNLLEVIERYEKK